MVRACAATDLTDCVFYPVAGVVFGDWGGARRIQVTVSSEAVFVAGGRSDVFFRLLERKERDR